MNPSLQSPFKFNQKCSKFIKIPKKMFNSSQKNVKKNYLESLNNPLSSITLKTFNF